MAAGEALWRPLVGKSGAVGLAGLMRLADLAEMLRAVVLCPNSQVVIKTEGATDSKNPVLFLQQAVPGDG